MLFYLVLADILFLCACWSTSISKSLILDSGIYNRLNPQPSAVDSKFLNGIAQASVRTLSAEIAVIDLTVPVDLDSMSQKHVFIRSGIYPQLLGTIRESKRTVLIGNPGTSKSFFQYYYLARLANPALLGPLPPDWLKCTAAPSIVVRQIGEESMTIYDLTSNNADKIKGIDSSLLACFDPKSTVYLHEPRTSLAEPLFYGHNIPLLSTVSPDAARYKEMVKNGADQVYMPLYKLSELLTIGRFLIDQGVEAEGVSYADTRIKERYLRYGGIFRHVLPMEISAVRSAAREQKKALQSADAGVLLASSDIEQPEISHYLLQYKVQQTGKDKFRSYSIDIANEYVRKHLQAKFNARTLDERVVTLIRNDETGFMDTECEKLYESVLADSLVVSGGVTWKCRREAFLPANNATVRGKAAHKAADTDWQPMTLTLKRVDRTEAPTFANMEVGVVYHPTEKNYPAVDFMFKMNDSMLVGVQVTRMLSSDAKKVKAGAILDLLERVGLSAPDACKLHLVLVPRPKMQDKARLVLVDSTRGKQPHPLGTDMIGTKKQESVKAADLGLREYTVWGVPLNYGLRYVGLK